VYDYDRAISDVADFASSNVLWIDRGANYAVYNAAGVGSRYCALCQAKRHVDPLFIVSKAVEWLQLRFHFDLTAIPPRYDHSTSCVMIGLLHCGLNK